jgi:hypothetical protein
MDPRGPADILIKIPMLWVSSTTSRSIPGGLLYYSSLVHLETQHAPRYSSVICQGSPGVPHSLSVGLSILGSQLIEVKNLAPGHASVP